MIFLVGMMGSGKTRVGRMAASRLDVPFVDLDARVEEAAGRTISRLWEEEGEEGFRRRESEALREAAAGEPAVVATGGGAVLDPANVRLMRERGVVVWLEAPPAVLAARLTGAIDRPLVADGPTEQRLAALLAGRQDAYRAAAHHRIDAAGEPHRVAGDVAALWPAGERSR